MEICGKLWGVMPEDHNLSDWLAAAMDRAEMSQSELARQLSNVLPKKYLPTTVHKMLNRVRTITVQEAVALSRILKAKLPSSILQTKFVPLVGFVGAGASAVLYEEGQGPFEPVEAPPDSTASMVAVEVRGDSMYPLAHPGWLLYYDRRDAVDPAEYIGQLAAVGLRDGQILFKILERGSAPGRFDLISVNASPMRDVPLEWVAPIAWIKPVRPK